MRRRDGVSVVGELSVAEKIEGDLNQFAHPIGFDRKLPPSPTERDDARDDSEQCCEEFDISERSLVDARVGRTDP